MSSDNTDELVKLAREQVGESTLTDVERFVVDFDIKSSGSIQQRVPYEVIYLAYLKWKIETDNIEVTTRHKFHAELSKLFERSRTPFTRFYNVVSSKIVVSRDTKREAVLDSLQEKEYFKWLKKKQKTIADLNRKIKRKEIKRVTKGWTKDSFRK